MNEEDAETDRPSIVRLAESDARRAANGTETIRLELLSSSTIALRREL